MRSPLRATTSVSGSGKARVASGSISFGRQDSRSVVPITPAVTAAIAVNAKSDVRMLTPPLPQNA